MRFDKVHLEIHVKMSIFKKNSLLHSIGIMAFLAIPLLFPSYSTPFLMKELESFVLIVLFFYLNYYYLITTFYFKKKYVSYVSILLVLFILITILPVSFLFNQSPALGKVWTEPHGMSGFLSPFYTDIKRNLLLFATAFFASIAFRINDHLKKLNQEKINAELSYLKAQINPHFLFNTLNSIYSLAIVKSEKTATSIVKLSGMMRYVISETSKKFVSLEKEMNYIDSYIDLQKIRLGETAIVNYSFNGDVKDKLIAPLMLIPFIENAFKHGVNPEEPSQIDIQLSVSETNLYLHVFNLKVPHRFNKADHSGFGLKNAKDQLTYLYPGKHQLKIEDTSFSFTVTLNINIT